MAGLPDDFNEDDFEDYNPHPYLGGYDITGTYGEPLPPSAAICYPISSSLSSPPVAAPPVDKVDLSSDEVPVKEANDVSESVPALAAEPEAEKPLITPVVEQPWSEPYEYSEPYQPEPYKPDLFRSWPFSIPQHCCCHKKNGQVRDFDYWNHMMRGLDFLFGHAQGYGERRAGVDVYGTPVYANKRTATESVAVHVEQPPVQRLEYHQSSAVQVHPDGLDTHMQWPSWYEERKEDETERYGNNYQSSEYYNYEQQTSYWDLDSSHHDTYDWRHSNLGYSSNVEGESLEETLFSTPVYSYNKNYHEQPLHVEVELADETWTQKMISYENNHSSYYEKGEEVHQPNRLSYGHERERYGHTQYEHLEPFKPSWSQNMSYSGEYLEGEMLRSEDYATFYGGEGNVSKALGYNEGNIYYYEQNQSSWSTADSRVLYGEDVSTKPSWDNESRTWTDAIFGSSHNYYAYDQ